MASNSWRDTITTAQPEKLEGTVKDWRQTITTEEPEPEPEPEPEDWRNTVEVIEPEDKNIVERIVEGASTPFGSLYGKEDYTRTFEATPKQQAIIEEKAEREGPIMKSLISSATGGLSKYPTAVMEEVADNVLSMFGSKGLTSDLTIKERVEIEEKLEDYFREKYPIQSTVGTVGGFMGVGSTAAKLGAKVALGIGTLQSASLGGQQAKEGKGVEAVSRTIAEDLVSLGVLNAVGSGISKLKKPQVPEIEEAPLLGAADEVATVDPKDLDAGVELTPQARTLQAKYVKAKARLDKRVQSVDDLKPKEKKEFERTVLTEDVESYQYGDIPEMLETYKSAKAFSKALAKSKLPTAEVNALQKTGIKLMDAQYYADLIDRRYGTDFMFGVNTNSKQANRALHKAKEVKQTFQEALNESKEALPYSITSKEGSKRLIKETEAGELKDSPVSRAFEEVRTSLNKAAKEEGFKEDLIAKRKNYIPRITKPAYEVSAIVNHKVKKLIGKDAKDILPEDIKELGKDRDIRGILTYYGGAVARESIEKNPKYTAAILKDIESISRNAESVQLDAGALKERKQLNMPELIREYDIGTIMNRYADSITRDIYLRKSLTKIKTTAEQLYTVDPTAASYFTDYVQDLTKGFRTNVKLSDKLEDRIKTTTEQLADLNRAENPDEFSELLYRRRELKRLKEQVIKQESSDVKETFYETNKRWASTYKKNMLENKFRAEDAGNPRRAKFYEAAVHAPEVMTFAQAQLYPFFLGLRVDAVIRNHTQPYLLTLPSFEAAYAAKMVPKAALTSASNFIKSNRQTVKLLEKEGWLPPDPTPGAVMDLAKGVSANVGLTKARKGIDKLNNIAMYLYQQSDLANRAVTLGIGKTVGDDLFKGVKGAVDHVKGLPHSYKTRVEAALAEGNKEEATRLITDHLMATTQFNYNKESLSAFGREMGSMFKMFSKWLSAVGGDMANLIDKGKYESAVKATELKPQTKILLRKYFAGYFLLSGAQFALSGRSGIPLVDKPLGLKEDRNYQRELFLGRDVTGMSPLTSVIAKPGDAFTPPVIDAAADVANLNFNTFLGLIPGMTYPRFFTERLPKAFGEPGKTIPAALSGD